MSLLLPLAGSLHLATLALSGGAGLTTWLVATDSAETRRLRRLAVLAIAVAMLLQPALLAAHATEVLDTGATILDPRQILSVAQQTWVGQVLLVQSAGLVWVAALLTIKVRLYLAGLAASCCLAVGALAGHVASSAGTIWLTAAAVLHTMAAGAWFGTVACLLLFRSDPDQAKRDSLLVALRRFSPVALPGMALIVTTGVAQASWSLGGLPGLLGSAYGGVLSAKVAILGGALACAAWLRVRLRRTSSAAGFRPVLAFETAGALLVVVLAATLARLPPGAHADIVWPWRFRLAPQTAWLTIPGAAWRMESCAALIAGGLIAALAFGARRRGKVAAIAASISLVAACFALPAASVPAYPTTYKHAPTQYDAPTIDAGATLFARHCAGCHGSTGCGDGPASVGLVPSPADLTAPHLGYHTHGDLFWWISNGYAGSAMPGFADRLSENQRWSLIEFLMALSLGHQARVLGPTPVAGDPWLPAIDFGFPDGTSLARLRGAAVVLLFANDATGAAAAQRFAEAATRYRLAATLVGIFPRTLQPGATGGLRAVTDHDGQIWRAWSQYRRTLARPDRNDRDPPPPLMGVLIDRFGFVRARWRSDEPETSSPSEVLPSALERAIEALAREPLLASVDDHAH